MVTRQLKTCLIALRNDREKLTFLGVFVNVTKQASRIATEYTEKYGQAARTISIGQLNTLLYLHFQPINQVVSLDPSAGLCLRDVSS